MTLCSTEQITSSRIRGDCRGGLKTMKVEVVMDPFTLTLLQHVLRETEENRAECQCEQPKRLTYR